MTSTKLETARRKWWTEEMPLSEKLKRAYSDYSAESRSSAGLWAYLADIVALSGYRPEEDVVQEQRQASADIVEEVFENVPEDHVIALMAQELASDLLVGEVVHKRFDD